MVRECRMPSGLGDYGRTLSYGPPPRVRDEDYQPQPPKRRKPPEQATTENEKKRTRKTTKVVETIEPVRETGVRLF